MFSKLSDLEVGVVIIACTGYVYWYVWTGGCWVASCYVLRTNQFYAKTLVCVLMEMLNHIQTSQPDCARMLVITQSRRAQTFRGEGTSDHYCQAFRVRMVDYVKLVPSPRNV